jgi:Protein of unknown function (DUF1638)
VGPLTSVNENSVVCLHVESGRRVDRCAGPTALANGCHQFQVRPGVRAQTRSPWRSRRSMRLKLITCDLFEREVQAAAARSSNRIEVEFLRKVSHQTTETEMVRSLQLRVNRARRTLYHAVLVVTGSCEHGLSGLQARTIPLVLPRAKDCISLLLERTAPSALPAASGTWAQARGAWTGGSAARESMRPRLTHGAMPFKTPARRARRTWTADSLTESWKWREHLSRRGTGATWKSRPARQRLSLLEMLVEGYWNYDEFLVIPPGWQVRVNHDQGTIAAEPLPP